MSLWKNCFLNTDKHLKNFLNFFLEKIAIKSKKGGGVRKLLRIFRGWGRNFVSLCYVGEGWKNMPKNPVT
jgi:hypothetical protein